MNRFVYRQAGLRSTTRCARARPRTSRFLAGGTNLVDLMKENVERPVRVVDISRLPLATDRRDRRRRAAARRARHQRRHGVRPARRRALSAAGVGHPGRRQPAAAQRRHQRRQPQPAHALLLLLRHGDAVQQARARQRLRRDRRRQPHPRDPRRERAVHRHASVGHVRGARGARRARSACTVPTASASSPFADYHRLPGDEPWRDNTLEPGELVTAIDLPAEGFARNYTYLKLRDRLSYAFALVSVAVGAAARRRRRIAEARIALGGVAHKPWRVPAAESSARRRRAVARGCSARSPTRCSPARVGQGDNDFKIELAQTRDRARAAAGRGRHAAIADRQAHRLRNEPMTRHDRTRDDAHRRAAQPRRRPSPR